MFIGRGDVTRPNCFLCIIYMFILVHFYLGGVSGFDFEVFFDGVY